MRASPAINSSLACLILSACISGPLPTVEGITRLKENPDRINLTASITGKLVIVDGCFRVQTKQGASLAIVWPEHATLADDRRSIILDGRLARTGSRLTLGGATADSASSSDVEQLGHHACEGPFFIVSNTT